jgi:uncharacterized protein involved in exopolysaccharide biosynthesis
MENIKTREIDVVAVFKVLLKQWRYLARFAAVGAVVGVIVALCTPKSFTASVTLAPEMNSGGIGLSGNLADMASSFGIDIGGKSSVDAIYPELYPDIFATTDFLLSLYDVPVRLKEDDTVRKYIDHFKKDLKIPFWNYPKIWIAQMLTPKEGNNGKNGARDPFRLSKEDDQIIEGMRNSIICTVDKKTSVININVIDQDPLVAAIMADTLQRRLQLYITEYRTKKARNDYDFYKKLSQQLRHDYERSREIYTSYADANQGVQLQSLQVKIEELENNMQLKYDNYKNSLELMRQAHAKIQERTPAFVILERPLMPHKASSAPRALIVLLWIFLFVVVGAAKVMYKEKKEIN